VNYIPFLNKNTKSKNQYKVYKKKKNTHKILISTSAFILLTSGFVALVMKTNNENNSTQISERKQENKHNFTLTFPLTTNQTHKQTFENTNTHIKSVELPEIVYKAEIVLPANHLLANLFPVNLFPVKKAKIFSVTGYEKTSPAKTISPEPGNAASQPLVTKQSIIQTIDANFSVTKLSHSTNSDLSAFGKTLIASLIEVPAQSNINTENINTTKDKTVSIKSGDTLSGIFKRLSLSSKTLYKIMKSGSDAKRLTRIKPGQKITFTLDNDNQLVAISYPFNKIDTLIISRKVINKKVINKNKNSYTTQINSKEVETQQQFASASIKASLFTAGNQAGLSNSMIMKLAQLFGWDIDFALDIRKGDSFSLVYEEKFVNGKKISEGDILAAEFINQGKTFYAVRYTDASGRTDYYSDKGYSMRKAFLRTPVEFSRISSRFSSKRKHPVLNRIRAHKGVDYAASRGTAVKAAGKGKVIFKGKKGGYGRVIILQHGSKYTTLYAHLNTYNKTIKKGSRVKQGQIIAYVGSSGLATGPHLHYEFRVNGVHRNPLTVPLPSAAPLANKYRTDFGIIAENMISQIKSRKQSAIALKSE
jgi:murein DD-endopeptidase MepM/ murein hydrolase activator NlpD